MEQERIKAIKLFEEREARRAEERKKGAEIIRIQIKEREAERIRQQQMTEKEKEQVLERI
jgi:hypothetical protein